MNTALYTHTMTIARPTIVEDLYGTYDEILVNVAEQPCRLFSNAGGPYKAHQKNEWLSTHMIITDNVDIEYEDKIIIDSKTYDIVNVDIIYAFDAIDHIEISVNRLN